MVKTMGYFHLAVYTTGRGVSSFWTRQIVMALPDGAAGVRYTYIQRQGRTNRPQRTGRRDATRRVTQKQTSVSTNYSLVISRQFGRRTQLCSEKPLSIPAGE